MTPLRRRPGGIDRKSIPPLLLTLFFLPMLIKEEAKEETKRRPRYTDASLPPLVTSD